jgi:hypothetical protein
MIDIIIPSNSDVHKWTLAELKSKDLVFDGGDDNTEPLTEPVSKKSKHKSWCSLRICDGELYVADTKRSNMGLVHFDQNGDTVFIRAPRKAALEITKMSDEKVLTKYCKSLHYAEMAQRGSLFRSVDKGVYTDSKYGCAGVQPCRASPGVRDASYHKRSMPSAHWNNLVETLFDVEKVVATFVSTEELRRVNFAKELIGYKTMTPTSDDTVVIPCKIFGALAYGRNVHLSCHTDRDFSKSVVSVHIDGKGYKVDDAIVAYFCFPRLGIAVALRPGDVLIFNPSEPHAISSRCNKKHDVFCVSMYLKTAVVSLNDNSLPLTKNEDKCLKHYMNNSKRRKAI